MSTALSRNCVSFYVLLCTMLLYENIWVVSYNHLAVGAKGSLFKGVGLLTYSQLIALPVLFVLSPKK